MTNSLLGLLNKKWIKISLFFCVFIFVCFISLMQYIMTFAPTEQERTALRLTTSDDLMYLKDPVSHKRGRILAVVTSVDQFPNSDKATGYELTELARAYWVFKANGFEVDIASPKGGNAPKVIDADDMGPYDYAFLNDREAQIKRQNTIRIDEINAQSYDAIYIVGGKGAMFDLPSNKSLQNVVSELFKNGKVISAVCHGPAALVNVKDQSGEYLVNEKRISSFTNEEEIFLIPNAKTVFPFLLETKLIDRGAIFVPGSPYLEQVSKDGKLITGQNPWSVWKVAETVVSELGYTPKRRPITPEENSISLLISYEAEGYDRAHELLKQEKTFSEVLLLMHGIVAAMQWQLSKAFDLVLLSHKAA